MDARAEAPAPPKAGGYPAVEGLLPKPKMMTADEQLKIRKELTAARDRQAAPSKGQESGAPEPRKDADQPSGQAGRQ
jgi:hypothetical protein